MKLIIISVLFSVSTLQAQSTFRFFINNINLPMNNSGTLADINIPPDGRIVKNSKLFINEWNWCYNLIFYIYRKTCRLYFCFYFHFLLIIPTFCISSRCYCHFISVFFNFYFNFITFKVLKKFRNFPTFKLSITSPMLNRLFKIYLRVTS